MHFFNDLLKNYGFNTGLSEILSIGIVILLLTVSVVVVHFISKKIILSLIAKYIKKNRFEWDNVLLERKVFHKLLRIIPVVMVYTAAPVFGDFDGVIKKAASIIIILISIDGVNATLDAILDIYNLFPVSKVRPIKGLLQVAKIVFYIVMGILVIAIFLEKEPIILLSGIGAMTAVFSLVFKDSILGLVAGIQLSSNDMLRIGDWIQMTKFGADGNVIDISLNTVKVQNFDKTISTIPAYSLISDSFKNWRGMREAGGRRIKRAIYIDTTSIRFCTDEMIERFKKINCLKNYIMNKEKEIDRYNKKYNVTGDMLINGRRLTNVGTYRAYIKYYLKNHPNIHQGMLQIVRQLQPGEYGLPLEIYAFTNDTDWVNYEAIQSDIFDHIIAVAPEFGLRLFQYPTGHDLKTWVDADDK